MNTLKQTFYNYDCVGRYCGEEFLVRLHETHQEQALAVNERIGTIVENDYIEGFAVTISPGIFVLRNDDAAIEGMLRRGRCGVRSTHLTEKY